MPEKCVFQVMIKLLSHIIECSLGKINARKKLSNFVVVVCSIIKINNKKKVIMENFDRERLRKKCPYSKLFWSAFSHIRTEYGERHIQYLSIFSPNAGKLAPE